MIKDVIYKRLCDFDKYSRDKDENDCNGNELEQFVENIISDNALKVNNKENYLKYLLRINNKIYDAKKYKFLFYRIYGNPNKRVSAYMNRDIIKQWKNKNSVFILAGTGKGKNYFIKNGLIDKYPKRKIVIFVNRQTLLRQ